MLALKAFAELCLETFQSLLMKTTLANTAVLCSNCGSRSGPVTVVWGEVQRPLHGSGGLRG